METNNKQKGLLIVISGPSGVGKGTICNELFSRSTNLRNSVSATTRSPRTGEQNGVSYFFKTREEFEKMIAEGGFLESCEVFGNYYGTPRSYVEEQRNAGFDVILEIDVQGGLKVKANSPDVLMIFILPPSEEELLRRLRGRGTDSDEVIERRIRGAAAEMSRADEYDYKVVNYDFVQTAEQIGEIIRREKEKRK